MTHKDILKLEDSGIELGYCISDTNCHIYYLGINFRWKRDVLIDGVYGPTSFTVNGKNVGAWNISKDGIKIVY